MTIDANKVVSGTYGTLYINIDGTDTELGNVSKFEGKCKGIYEEVGTTNVMGKARKLVGFEISGSFTLSRLNYDIPKAVFANWKNGITPAIRLVGSVNDPSADDNARVVFTGVTLEEIALLDFEAKKLTTEEYSFEAIDADFA